MSDEKIKCAYCGNVRDKSEMKQADIIFQDNDRYGKRFVNRKTNWYCKDKGCATKDQMAHVG
jgi:hypothetical protein